MFIDKTKYSGKNYSFIFKLTRFFDISARADWTQEILLESFFTMFTNLAFEYYYSNTTISIFAIFDKICNLIKTDFEEAEYKKSKLSKWKMTTFKFIIKKNEWKSMKKYLEFLIKNLCYLQYGLDAEFWTENFIYNKLSNACPDLFAC